MPKINVARAFKLNLTDGSFIDFAPGEQTVKADIADHWFVKANLVGAAEKTPPAPGSFEYGVAQRNIMAEAEEAKAEKAAAEEAKAEEARKVSEAEQRQKTAHAIAQGAVQAEAFAKKDDPADPAAVTDIPNPLTAAPKADEGSEEAAPVEPADPATPAA